MSDAPERREHRESASGRARALQSALERLRARRWLLVATACVLIALVLLGQAAWMLAIVGFVVVTLTAAVVPRDIAPRPVLSSAAAWDRKTREQLRVILDALPDPAIVLGRDGAVLQFNAKAREQFGRLKPGSDIASIVRNPEFLDAMAAAEAGAAPQTIVYSERVPVGRRIAATIAPLALGHDEGREGPAVLVSMRDLTEQERLTQMRADFIANASHELRTPLASLSGFIETLQGPARNDPEASERFLSVMAAQARRMSRLIDDLLSLSHVEMSAHLVPSARVDLADVLRHVIEALDPLARESKIVLEANVPADAVWMRGDRDELVQLFQNLIQNAIKYGREGGHVWVRLDRLASQKDGRAQLVVEVKDDGLGIAAEHLPRLTERFYRVDVASSREKEGTGLGLAIVKHVVNRHRGELRIASAFGEGSTFTVIFEAESSA